MNLTSCSALVVSLVLVATYAGCLWGDESCETYVQVDLRNLILSPAAYHQHCVSTWGHVGNEVNDVTDAFSYYLFHQGPSNDTAFIATGVHESTTITEGIEHRQQAHGRFHYTKASTPHDPLERLLIVDAMGSFVA